MKHLNETAAKQQELESKANNLGKENENDFVDIYTGSITTDRIILSIFN